MVKSRIKQAPACQVIELSESEKNLYLGSGYHLAHFREGVLVELKHLLDFCTAEDDSVNSMVKAALAWHCLQDGEVWLVMCSSYELCEPRRLSVEDVASFAKLGNAFVNELRGF